VRVAWLYGPGGNNFPAKIIQAADRLGSLRVVADEVGNPTYAPDAAQAMLQLIQQGCYGIYHLTNQGQASRYEWAREILSQSGRGEVPVTPIALADWPRPAPPPPHAVLVNQAAAALGIQLRPWQVALQDYFSEQSKYLLNFQG
jgi:dTDP-4-dehydrorhamnose reductase